MMESVRGSEESSPATKADIACLRADLAGLREETKTDTAALRGEVRSIKGGLENLARSHLALEAKVGRIESSMATKSDIERVLGAIDAFTVKAQAYDQKTLSHPEMLQDHEARLVGHEKRLAALETRD